MSVNDEVYIGELARESGITPKTIRYYEEVGLLPTPKRGDNGYRVYSLQDVERLHVIRRAKTLGLSLADIKMIADHASGKRCGELKTQVLSLLNAKIVNVNRMMEDLRLLREDLQQYRDHLRAILSIGNVESTEPVPLNSSCKCMSQEIPQTDADQRAQTVSNAERREITMTAKSKKDPTVAKPEKGCGCGCVPSKK